MNTISCGMVRVNVNMKRSDVTKACLAVHSVYSDDGSNSNNDDNNDLVKIAK